MSHISDHDLERYYLGQITDEAELAPLEKHLLWCHECLDRTEAAEDYVDAVRIALLRRAEAKGELRMHPLHGQPYV